MPSARRFYEGDELIKLLERLNVLTDLCIGLRLITGIVGIRCLSKKPHAPNNICITRLQSILLLSSPLSLPPLRRDFFAPL